MVLKAFNYDQKNQEYYQFSCQGGCQPFCTAYWKQNSNIAKG